MQKFSNKNHCYLFFILNSIFMFFSSSDFVHESLLCVVSLLRNHTNIYCFITAQLSISFTGMKMYFTIFTSVEFVYIFFYSLSLLSI